MADQIPKTIRFWESRLENRGLLCKEGEEVSKDWYQDIVDFMTAIEQHKEKVPKEPSQEIVDLRVSLIDEEVNKELLKAMEIGDLPGIADGIADSMYVHIGAAVAYGIDLRPIWDTVHEANMKKVGGPVREDGKRLKPKEWVPPDIKGELIKQGWNGK